MKYKLIAVDMDGTLLDDNKNISPLTIKAIQKAESMGIIFTISTGRPIMGVEKYNQILNLKSPIITYNGAAIVKADTKKVLFIQNLLEQDAIKILELGSNLGITMCIWAHDNLYCNVLNELVMDYKKLSDVEPILINDFTTLAKEGITKILWYSDATFIENVQLKLKNINFNKVSFYTSKPTFLEFVHSDVSKARAMEQIGKMYGISRKEMIAVGDGQNDLPMIEYAGLGVAMANSSDEIKQKANYVTKNSNNNDGVVEVMDKFIF